MTLTFIEKLTEERLLVLNPYLVASAKYFLSLITMSIPSE